MVAEIDGGRVEVGRTGLRTGSTAGNAIGRPVLMAPPVFARPGLAGVGCLGAGPLESRVSGRLAGARPWHHRPYVRHSIRVASAHCDGRERRALFTSQNSNEKHPIAPVLHHSVISSGSASAVQHTPKGTEMPRTGTVLCVPCRAVLVRGLQRV